MECLVLERRGDGVLGAAAVGLFTVYFLCLQKYLYNKYSLIYISICVNQY